MELLEVIRVLVVEGGIIRDDHGCMLVAFSNFLSTCSNMLAEFLTLKEGLYLRLQLDIDLQHVETKCDSKVVVDMLHCDTCNVWQLKKDWNEVLALCK